ncbi:hypothetical protein E1162_11545 [Rhodobacteraceae bacterium RKSG542]|uniref:L,D-transpeptidase family protein n=1 Tax=Pseudovibrio flavus TaxID=2529854 RepID=UPI0012BB884D|nr:L,D-transpeptidase family protein [Pseudovibrio flavus]MTI17871.1 hypothetical protein [Pseudovibrio flavus]
MLKLSRPVGGTPQKTIAVKPRSDNPQRGLLNFCGITYPCALGRSGITANKQEGDGATPIGTFEFLDVYYRDDRGGRPETYLPTQAITSIDGWCDDVTKDEYNRPVELPYSGSHEKMWREDRLYDIVVVLNQNLFPALKGAGSAIFFHIAREGFLPTEGCVAVYPDVMRHILKQLKAGDVMQISSY